MVGDHADAGPEPQDTEAGRPDAAPVSGAARQKKHSNQTLSENQNPNTSNGILSTA